MADINELRNLLRKNFLSVTIYERDGKQVLKRNHSCQNVDSGFLRYLEDDGFDEDMVDGILYDLTHEGFKDGDCAIINLKTIPADWSVGLPEEYEYDGINRELTEVFHGMYNKENEYEREMIEWQKNEIG